MSDAAHMPDDDILARLAARDLAAAERVHDKLMAAEETADIAELGRTCQRLARSVRQTLALKAKLARDRDAAAAPKAPPKPPPTWPDVELQRLTPAVRARIDRVRDAVMPYFEREAEAADYDGLDEIEIYEILIDMADEPSFLDAPVEDLSARVLETMGLPARSATPPDPADAEPAVDDSA